jgi:tRNA-dihydrouridine synthase B
LTVHGRTAADLYRGRADWDRIAEIKPHLKRIPLIGNGDLTTVAAVVDALRRYPVDGIMVGRAALGRPWLFQQIQAALRGEPAPPEPSLDQQRQLLIDHYRLICRRFGPTRGSLLMRRYACCYAQGQPGARAFRAAVGTVDSPEAFYEAVQRCFPRNGSGRSQL